MPTTGTKISAVTSASPTDDSYVPYIDPAGATPAGKAKRALFSALATYVLGKREGIITEEEGLLGSVTQRRGISPAVLKAIITGLVNGGQTLHKYNATAAPAATNDNTQGYSVGSLWLWPSQSRVWMAKSVATNVAVWVELTGGLTSEAVNTLITAALATFAESEGFETAVNGLIDSALEGFEGGGGLSEAAVNALIAAALEEFEGGGTTLPVDDTTALVKDPVDATRQLRIDAGNVPTGSTAVLQSPGVSAVAGLIVIERSVSGTPLDTGTRLICVAARSGRVVGCTAYTTASGAYPVVLQLIKNSSSQGTPWSVGNGESIYSIMRYGRQVYDIAFNAGDVLEFMVLSGGDTDYSGSGMSGTGMNGTLVLQVEMVYSPE